MVDELGVPISGVKIHHHLTIITGAAIVNLATTAAVAEPTAEIGVPELVEMTALAALARGTIAEITGASRRQLEVAEPITTVGKTAAVASMAALEVAAVVEEEAAVGNAGSAETGQTEHSISRALGSRTSTRQDLTEDNILMHAGTTAVSTSRWVTLRTIAITTASTITSRRRTVWVELALPQPPAGSLVKTALGVPSLRMVSAKLLKTVLRQRVLSAA